MENYRCIDCGSVFKDDELDSNMLFCPSCGSRLEEESFQKTASPKSNTAYEYQKEEVNYHKKSEDSRQEQEYFTFSCLSCSKSLRIAF
jgi:DNA-directed RNA polymerase subunit RPC12/RpoP